MADEPSIWKKEIKLRKKPKEKGVRVPAAAADVPKPDSVADLLRPIAEDTLEPVILPPVTPPVTSPVAPPVSSPVTPPVTSPVAPPVTSPVAPPVTSPVAPPVTSPGAPPFARPAAPPFAQPVRLPAEEPESGHEPAGDDAPEPEPPTPVAGETVELPAVELGLPAAVAAPILQDAPPRPTRRSRKQAKREAARADKENAKREKQAAKAAAKESKKRPGPPHAHKRLVGLKIGASQLAAVQMVNSHGPRVVRMARAPLEHGVVVGGELREPDQLAAALKTFFRKNKLPKNAVRLGIANNRIGVRTFDLSGIDDPKQLANAIRFRAQETLPIPLDEAVLDYRILSETVGEDGGRTRRVLLVVAHKELVERYVAACRKAGLKLVGIDLEAFALLRALGDPTAPAATAEDAGLVCLSIGHDRTSLAVSDGRVCEFTRVLSWGGASLDIALARVLDLTPSEAEPLKHELSLTDEGESASLDAARADAARRAMSKELEVFARELVASLRFYQEQPGSLGIGEILLTGGGAQCGGFAEELERLIGVSVRVADPLGRVKIPRKLRKTASAGAASLAVAVGLGIED